ncbi:hypothetical protein MTR_7g024530 [Medicago truncatula]|uniref:TIR domain-containing protein n=1 Tax=Medicago truncatula TaxID=3880 RepID=G7KWW0_MEDTR|nr:hypothetical protein MTR_7g024530 [Medicago truncatula]
MLLRTLLIPKGQKEVEKGEGLVNTSLRREKRGKTHEASTVNFGVWNALCELSIYRESSHLISEKLWETGSTQHRNLSLVFFLTQFPHMFQHRGVQISPTIFKAIEKSRMAITVFSKTYELVKFPVFYNVDPSEIGNQSGACGQQLAKHE